MFNDETSSIEFIFPFIPGRANWPGLQLFPYLLDELNDGSPENQAELVEELMENIFNFNNKSYGEESDG